MLGARLSIVALIALLVVAVGAQAAGNEQSGPTVGDCMSDALYGNEPNMADGSPGGPACRASSPSGLPALMVRGYASDATVWAPRSLRAGSAADRPRRVRPLFSP